MADATPTAHASAGRGTAPGAAVHVLWLTTEAAGAGGVPLAAAALARVREITAQGLPGLPPTEIHRPIAGAAGTPGEAAGAFLACGGPTADQRFVLVVEGPAANGPRTTAGYGPGHDGPPRTAPGSGPHTAERLARLAPHAFAVVAVGPCADDGTPTAGGLLGPGWTSRAGIPTVCVPGSPVRPDDVAETVTYLLCQAAGSAPMIPLDARQRPAWLFAAAPHQGRARAGYSVQGAFTGTHRGAACPVKLGCRGTVAPCGGAAERPGPPGGCPHADGFCVACAVRALAGGSAPPDDGPPTARAPHGSSAPPTAVTS